MTEATGGGGRPDVQRRLAKGSLEDDPSRRALPADGGELSDQDLEAVVGGLRDRVISEQQLLYKSQPSIGEA
jgi:hypothetical protein